MVEHAGSIVENEAVDLANADDDLEGMAERMGGCYEGCHNKAERSPGELHIRNQHRTNLGTDEKDTEGRGTNSSDSFHAQHEGVGSQISRVREGIFLPQLAEKILRRSHASVIKGKVSC